MDDAEILAWYGPWAGLSPPDVAEMLARFDRPWWITGGWAIEAFTGVARPHVDVDLAFFRDDLTSLRRALAPRQVWSAGDGMLRPVTDETPELHPGAHQVWVRADAASPWLVDALADPGDADCWVYRRDPTITAPLAEVTWEVDGIRYLRPEIAVLVKAGRAAAKDTADLAEVLPRLGADRRQWLAATLGRLHPGHPWLERCAVSERS